MSDEASVRAFKKSAEEHGFHPESLEYRYMSVGWDEATRQAEARMRVELNETANANYIAGKEQGEKQIAEARLKEAGWWALQRVEYGSEKATKHIAELERELAAMKEGK